MLLKLRYDAPLSHFTFNFNLRRYIMADPILFGDFLNAPKEVAGEEGVLRLYENVGAFADIKPLFEELLGAYNDKHKTMNLVGRCTLPLSKPS
jgi:hypothetical protein